MMSREQLLQIFGSLDTDSLIDMLAVKGININRDPEMGEVGYEEPESKIESWNDVRIKGGKDSRPDLISRQPEVVDVPPPTRKREPEFMEAMEEESMDSLDDYAMEGAGY